MKRLGPELKIPKLKGGEMKVPAGLSDFYYDLRDRRLLPLVGLILLAIVAAPILLGGGGDEAETVPPPAGIVGGSTPASEQSLTVVKAQPGLRNYRKRLGHRSPTDPFKQRFTAPRLNGAHLNEPTTSSSPTSSTSPSTTVSRTETSTETETTVTSTTGGSAPSGSSPGTGGGGGNDGGGDGGEELPHGLTLFTYALDIQITQIETKPDGSVVKSEPTLHKEVLAPAPLPGENAPVITYLGIGAATEQPMFLVSPEVTALYGKNECVAGRLICQLVGIAEGVPETFEYGANHVRYKINVVAIKPVVTGQS